jgi:hypothetical protein
MAFDCLHTSLLMQDIYWRYRWKLCDVRSTLFWKNLLFIELCFGRISPGRYCVCYYWSYRCFINCYGKVDVDGWWLIQQGIKLPEPVISFRQWFAYMWFIGECRVQNYAKVFYLFFFQAIFVWNILSGVRSSRKSVSRFENNVVLHLFTLILKSSILMRGGGRERASC